MNKNFRAYTINGYKDYSSFYIPETISYTYPDYSNILTSESNDYRFVTFKYTGTINNAFGFTLDFIESTNFSTVKPTDISLHIKIVNSTTTSNNTAWLNANESISGVGVNEFNKVIDGTMSSTSGSYRSTATRKYCYIQIQQQVIYM